MTLLRRNAWWLWPPALGGIIGMAIHFRHCF
jgi:hypothetical protein